MLVALCFIVAVFTAAACEAVELEMFPNVEYLGMGYNAVAGNPDHDLSDPGFVLRAVLEFTYGDNATTTSDGNYLLPDHILALRTRSCGFQSQAAIELGPTSYQEALSSDVSVEDDGDEVSIWNARFTASDGYRQVGQSQL